MTYRCRDCDVNWWAYQARDGRCPECGAGTLRVNAPGSLDADARFKAAAARRAAAAEREERVAAFERYAVEWDKRAMQQQLQEIAGLPELPAVGRREAA